MHHDMETERKLRIDYQASSILFEQAMKKFQLKRILYQTLFRGKGLEFDGYRSFDSEEDYGSIDWKATLRAGEKMVKQYKEERDVNVYFLVDCSSGMLFGSGSKLKAESVGEIVCVLVNLVLNSGDKAGFIMFSDREIKVLHPSSTKNQLLVIHKYLSDIENYGGPFEMGKALEFASRFIKGSSNNLLLFSDFIHLRKGFEKSLSFVSSRVDTLAIMVRDKFDEILPDVSYKFVLQDPHSKKQMVVDSHIARGRFNEQALKQKETIKKLFKEKRVDMLELRNTENFVFPLSNFMKRRAGELRV